MAIGRSVIHVSWSTPTVPRDELPIIGYNIQYQVRHVRDTLNTLMFQSSPAELTGLLPGAEYRVLVASVNALGTGEYCCNEMSSSIYVRTPNGKWCYCETALVVLAEVAHLWRVSTAMASFHCYGALLTAFPQQHFYDGASTIVILVIIMMLGQCMLPVIDFNNGESNEYTRLSLMECIAWLCWVSQQ